MGIELLHQDLCTGSIIVAINVCYFVNQRRNGRIGLHYYSIMRVIPIEDDYVIGKELEGRFSTVYECVNKMTGDHHAVRVDAGIESEEKALLRTEIVLKLVDHPNIIKMEGLYESRTHIYIVMEKLNGGELFERIVGRPRFSEEETANLFAHFESVLT